MDEAFKIRLLKAIGRDEGMREILLEIMDRMQAECCAFSTARDRELVYILCEDRELQGLIPEIREKIRLSYRMFTNGLEPERDPREWIMYRREGSTVQYLLAKPRIESYFLVPLTFGSKVRGVLYVASVRKEAFGRSDIAELRTLAEEEEERSPVAFRLGGERGVLDRFIAALPFGAALLSTEGSIIAANASFAAAFGIRDEAPADIRDIDSRSSFGVQGIWDEFSILQRDIVDRELKGSVAPERYISVSCVRVADLSEEVGALLLARDVTQAREQAEMREETVAMVAHELRTPLTALKNSLAIVAESSEQNFRRDGDAPAETGGAAGRFLANSLRTVERLGMLVDGLIDSSSVRIDERALRVERHDIAPFIEEASILFVEPMRKKGIDFRVYVDADASRLAFDRNRLEQVVQNLLANSMKHVPAGGAVSITVIPCASCPGLFLPAPLIGRVGPLSFADLCLRDTGGGIPEEVTNRLHRTADAAYRPIRASRGLGLRLAQRLIRLQGGSLAIEERVVGGSAVHLYLPADEATFGVVHQYRSAEMRLEEMLSRGLMPVVYCFERTEDGSWEETLSRGGSTAAVSPARSEPHEGALLVWPLGESFAVGIDPREHGTRRIPAGLRARRSVARRDGMHLGDLVAAALEMLEIEEPLVALKGESE